MSDLDKRAREWGAPRRALQVALASPKQTEALTYAKEFIDAWARDEAGIMVLAGGVGVGKTVAAVWAMVQIPPNQYGSFGARRFRHISELCEVGLRGGDEERSERGALKRAQVLVLDDVGTEHITDQFRTLFDGLINARYEETGATILTTNLPSADFRERYGQRIYDRLRGRGQWFDIGHESLRGG